MLEVLAYTDPLCPWSWAAEPAVRRARRAHGDGVRWTWVLAGRFGTVVDPTALALQALEAQAASGMPVDLRPWLDGRAPRSSHPACLAVLAAGEQGLDDALLRRVREALWLEGRTVDTTDGLVDLAGEVAGLDVRRFASALRSSALVEALAQDMARTADAAPAGEALPLPGFAVEGRLVADPPAGLRAALAAAGAEPDGRPPGVLEALREAAPGGLAAAEVAALCGLPALRAAVELHALAADLAARPGPAAGLWSVG